MTYEISEREYRVAFREFERQQSSSERRLPMHWRERMPMLGDSTPGTSFDAHYVYHTAWAARVLARQPPVLHVDIGSLVYFSVLVSAFIPVAFYEYRPIDIELDGLTARSADLTHLPFPDQSILSLSCMHTVEHIGLGRYGDALDVDGDLKAMRELQRVSAQEGRC